MQPAGLRTGFRHRVPCRSAVYLPLWHPLRSQLVRSGPLWTIRASSGPGDAAGVAKLGQGPGPGSASAAGGEAGDALAANSTSTSSGGPPGQATALSVPVAADGSPVAGAPESSPAQTTTSSQQQQQPAAQPANQPSAAGPQATAAADGAAPSSSSSSLPPFVQQLLSWLASVWSAVQQFPVWVQMQHVRRLREACEEDPKVGFC
jgi:hypothetical protein